MYVCIYTRAWHIYSEDFSFVIQWILTLFRIVFLVVFAIIITIIIIVVVGIVCCNNEIEEDSKTFFLLLLPLCYFLPLFSTRIVVYMYVVYYYSVYLLYL